jgi:hypothetical protein
VIPNHFKVFVVLCLFLVCSGISAQSFFEIQDEIAVKKIYMAAEHIPFEKLSEFFQLLNKAERDVFLVAVSENILLRDLKIASERDLFYREIIFISGRLDCELFVLAEDILKKHDKSRVAFSDDLKPIYRAVHLIWEFLRDKRCPLTLSPESLKYLRMFEKKTVDPLK